MNSFLLVVVGIMLFLIGGASAHNSGKEYFKQELLVTKRICYSASDAGMDFEKCYKLVEE